VHGLVRHVFDDEELERWADRRGVLMKSIEDGALGMASVFRALDQQLPATLPHADKALRSRFVDLVARIQPFDLVIDERTADGLNARVSRTSVAGSWGGTAGSLRWFADRYGVARASIEGTTIPLDLIRRYATEGPPEVVISGTRRHQGFALARRLSYFGFDLETSQEPIKGDVPEPHREAARALLVDSLLAGELEHPSATRLVRAVRHLREYWLRSGGALEAASDRAVRELLLAQLGDVDSWHDFQQTPLTLDVEAIVPERERAHLDALPSSVHLFGDMAPLDYRVLPAGPVVRLMLREGQLRRLRLEDLPSFDRALWFAVRRGEQELEAPTLERLRDLVDEHRDRELRNERQRDRGTRGGGGPRGNGRGPQSGGPPRRGGPGGKGRGKGRGPGRGKRR
jgi:hypothetical protein